MLPTASSPAVAAQPHDDVNRSLTWVGASNAATQAPTEWPGLTAWKSQTSSQQQGPSAGTALVNPGVGSEASSPAGSIPAPPFSLHGQSAQPTAASTSTGADPFASRAKTVLVLSILGIVLSLTCVGGLFAPVAWIMGNGVRSDARATGHAELRSNKVGRILAMTGTVLGVLVVLGFTAYWVTT